MDSMYHDGQRQLQDQFDTRRLADRLQEKLVKSALNPKQKAFIESADMFFLATADEHGHPSCSYRGGDPGFVRVLDDMQTLALPNYDGDGMYISWGNVVANPHVGLLFIDFMKGWRLRIHGEANISRDDPLMSEYPESQFIVKIKVREAFGNCPRYIHKYQLVERSTYVPRRDCVTPIPDWKKQPDIQDVLPRSS
ncbi:MAG TPA: pyridoxamine 5'-phosphate oxidase family protein [Tepidisphaeraceae bacterium]|jgi:predicted pyridoxine 5'-phosphate oxidase superfamily flavin-nucleotide-binding protein|nr:pyridoxamine 5'-phosphate oxidase family protein [Tepidisphaeraceae bacterium]